MNPAQRTLLQVAIPDEDKVITTRVVADLMGSKPEARFKFIQERAAFAADLDI